MKTLVLARHAKSDWSVGKPDFDRPLNPRGERDAPRMGKILHQYGLQPDLVLSSPANRAKTTAEIITRELGYNKAIQFEEDIYGGGYGSVLGLIQDLPDTAETVMVFGHNPTTEQLGNFLLQMRGSFVVPTCGMICLDIGVSNWSQISPIFCKLRWFLIPKLIKGADA